MAAKRGNPLQPPRASVDTTGIPEMAEVFERSSTLGKQAAAADTARRDTTRKVSKKEQAATDQRKQMERWERVDKARAIKGLPSLPKPGSREYRK